MKNTSRIRSSFILVLALLFWASVTSNPLPKGQTPKGATFESKQGFDQRSIEGGRSGVNAKFNEKNEEYYRGLMGRLGSIPPNCAHRCEGCAPCVPVQMPTTTDHIGVQYANYEPEGWKCKCGSTFFSP